MIQFVPRSKHSASITRTKRQIPCRQSYFGVAVVWNTSDRKCTYKRNINERSRNRRSCITYTDCVCGLSYPACKAHAPYYNVLWNVSGFTIFFHIIVLMCVCCILCVFVDLMCICCILCVFVVSYVYLLILCVFVDLMCICFILCVCCISCVFVVSYVYLLYLMCICCILCVFVDLMCICFILCVFVVSYVYLLILCVFVDLTCIC